MQDRMNVRLMDINVLKPAPYNPRKDLTPDDREWQKIERSLYEFDLLMPIVFNERTGHIIGGHQRVKILASHGITQVETNVLNIGEEEEKLLNVRLNKIKGHWDTVKLAALLREIHEEGGLDGIESAGFEKFEYESLADEFSHIDDLLDEDFSDTGKNESETFVITFTLPAEAEDAVNDYTIEHGKEAISELVMRYVRGEPVSDAN